MLLGCFEADAVVRCAVDRFPRSKRQGKTNGKADGKADDKADGKADGKFPRPQRRRNADGKVESARLAASRNELMADFDGQRGGAIYAVGE